MHAYVYHNLVCVILTKLRNVCASLSDISYYCIIISTMHKMTLFGTIKQYSFPKCTHLVHQKYWFYNCHHVYQDLVVLETVFFKEFSGNVGNKMLYNLSIISVQIEWMYFYIKNMCTKRCWRFFSHKNKISNGQFSNFQGTYTLHMLRPISALLLSLYWCSSYHVKDRQRWFRAHVHLVVRFLGYLGHLLTNLDIIDIKRMQNISAIEGYQVYHHW